MSLVQAEINGRETKIRLMNRQPVPDGGRDRKRPHFTHNAVSLTEGPAPKETVIQEKRSAEAWDCRLQTKGQIIKTPAPKQQNNSQRAHMFFLRPGGVANADRDL
ncbi:hypothetical protein DdX_22408 [Ditylenchus destructor]|uniref:Uncharacterized protein n=1 Tax=Ditylenchus destructor TaxID=166010 RepID=A0AAD4QQX2_9BILA|nr:hypothetical protein DdX_22408 [Ditylenchus destructor]